MNKTLTVSLAGQLFEIEENAFKQLENYLNSLKNYFKNDADGGEIIGDIEARIAELFIEQQTDNFKIVIKEQVEYVQMKMGTVKDFELLEDLETDNKSTASTEQATDQNTNKVAKKLMRDNEDRVLGGVCSGLGYYFQASPLLLRVLFLILLFVGPGFIVYLILWIIIPKANTATDKLLMKGLPVNVNTLADSIKTRTYSSNKLIDFTGQLITYFTKFAVNVAKLLLIVIGISLLFGLSVAFGVMFFGLIKSGAILNSFSVGSGFVFWFIKLMLLLVLAIPIVFIFVLLMYLMFNRNYFRANYVLPLAGLWLICTFCVGLYTKAVANDFSNENIVKQTTTIKHSTADTLFIAVKESDAAFEFENNLSFDGTDVYINGNSFNLIKDSLHTSKVNLLLQPGTNNKLNLEVEKFAKGKTEIKAAERATLTEYNWQLIGDTLWLPNYLAIDKNTKWRQQKIDLTLAIPKGKIIHLTTETDDILNNENENIQGINAYNMNERTWQMTANGLDCLDCNDAYEKIPQNLTDEDEPQINSKKIEAIEISGAIKLNLKQGKHKISVIDKEDNLKPFNFKKKDGLNVLQLATKSNVDETPELNIWLPNLKKFYAEGVCALNIENFTLDELEFTTEGAHSITIENITVNKLKLNTEGAASYKLTGQAKVFDLNSEGINSINAVKLKTENTTLNIEGAATGKFWVTENLNANINGPAIIKYKGNPKVEKDVSGFGSFKQIK